MNVIRIPAGPLRGVALETRRRTLPERLRALVRRRHNRTPPTAD